MSTFSTFLSFSRRPTRIVSVGPLKIGGEESICVQSMLTSQTCDLPRVLDEITTLAAVNCQLIRITVPNQRAVECLPAIRRGMEDRGIAIPLVADIHFNPKLAIDSCEFVEKVRINPGNYADRKRFEIREYSEARYQEELERIETGLLTLTGNLKKYGCALRIGVNHGSLCDRILNRYGDTPKGMVESALEFVRIFRKHHFNDIIISMKSSIPSVMVQAYRFLVIQMEQEGMDYPLHLGVTEAGNGLEARVKSDVGIGSLLMDGIGDTIRVSLTEPAENEIPAANSILQGLDCFRKEFSTWRNILYDSPVSNSKRATQSVTLKLENDACSTSLHPPQPITVGGGSPFAFLGMSSYPIENLASTLFDRTLAAPPTGKSASSDIQLFETSSLFFEKNNLVRMETPTVILIEERQIKQSEFSEKLKVLLRKYEEKLLLVRSSHPLLAVRFLEQLLRNCQSDWPLGIVVPDVDDTRHWSGLAADSREPHRRRVGRLFGLSHNRSPKTGFPVLPDITAGNSAPGFSKLILFPVLHVVALFLTLQTTTDAIKVRTQHLKGVKIGIMGCVVNGPGEMADADFGYVGSAKGKINLYRKQECVARNIPQNQAVERLIDLIKADGRWIAPQGE